MEDPDKYIDQVLGKGRSSKIESEKAAIERGAKELEIDPVDYATAISYESAGTFDPWVAGPTTKWGQHRGTIQYGEPQRKKYGVHQGQTFEDQVTRSNVQYLRDNGVKPGMTFEQIYAAINGGNVNKNLSTQDWNTGRSIQDNINKAMKEHRSKVLQRYGWTDPADTFIDRALGKGQPEPSADAYIDQVLGSQKLVESGATPSPTVPGNVYLPQDKLPTAADIFKQPNTPTVAEPPVQTLDGVTATEGPPPVAPPVIVPAPTVPSAETPSPANSTVEKPNLQVPGAASKVVQPTRVGSPVPPTATDEPIVGEEEFSDPDGEVRKVYYSKGKPKDSSAKEWMIADVATAMEQQGVPFEVTQTWLRNKGFKNLGGTADLADSDFDAIYDRGDQFFKVTNKDLDELHALTEDKRVGDEALAARKVRAEELTTKYIAEGEVDSIAQLRAAQDIGIKDIKGVPIESIIQEERDAFKRFNDEYEKQTQERIKQNEAYSSLTPTAPQFTASQREKYVSGRAESLKSDIGEAIANYGSFKGRENEKARIEKEYEFRPMARPTEVVKNFASYVAKLPAKALQAALIIGEGALTASEIKNNPASLANIVAGTAKEIKASDNPVWQWAEDYQKKIDSYKNPDFKDEFIVNELTEGFAQFATQAILTPLTGGASLALPLAESGVAQYKEADKAGANALSRLGSATMGVFAGAPGALINAKFLNSLTDPAKATILQKLANKINEGLAARLGAKEAETATRTFFQTAVENGAFGFGAEFGQERVEDLLNDIFAKATYKPELTWKEVLSTSPDKLKGYLAAGIVGATGAQVETVAEKLSTEELQKSQKILEQALLEGTITQEQKTQLQEAADSELSEREGGEPDKDRIARQNEVKDKQGRKYTVIEDKGDNLLVKTETGSEILRKKDKLTPINETQTETEQVATPVAQEPVVSAETPESPANVEAPLPETQAVTEPDPKGFEVVDQGTTPTPTTPEGRLKEQRDAAVRQAETSAVTGLPNKAAFQKAQPRIEADPEQEITTIDLNNFKQINDKNTHAVGDQALKDAGADLLAAAKELSDRAQVFHLSGDEFLIVSPKGVGQTILTNADKIFSERQYGDVKGSIGGNTAQTYQEAEEGLQAAKAVRKDAIPVQKIIADLPPLETSGAIVPRQRGFAVRTSSQPAVMRKVPDSTTPEMDEVVQRDTGELATAAKVTVDGSQMRFDNLEGYGFAVQALEQALDRDYSFFGATLQPNEVAKVRASLAAFRDSMGDNYTIEEKRAVKNFVVNFNLAASNAKKSFGRETVKLILAKEAIPEESVHEQRIQKMALDDVRKSQSPEYFDRVEKSPLFQNAEVIKKNYGDTPKEIQVIEFTDKLIAGNFEELGIDPVKDKEAIIDLVVDWANDFIATNGDNVNLDAYEQINETSRYLITKAKAGLRNTKESPDRAGNGDSAPGERETREDLGDIEQKERVTKQSKTPSTLREAGIPAQDRLYTATTNAERQNFANEQLDKGVESAQKWVENQINDNNLNSGATAVVGINVMQQLGKEGRIAELNDLADKLLPTITDAAQTVQAVSIVNMFSPDTAAAYVTKVAKKNGKDVTEEQVQKAQEFANRMSETVQAGGIIENGLSAAMAENEEVGRQLEEYKSALGIAEDQNKKLQIDLEGASKTIADLRKKIDAKKPKKANEKLEDIKSRKDDIIAALSKKYADIANTLQMAARRSEVDQDLIDWATLYLSDNLGKVSVQEFKDTLNAVTNNSLTQDEMREIHAEAVDTIRGEKKEVGDKIKEANKLRKSHYREADMFAEDQLSDVEKMLKEDQRSAKKIASILKATETRLNKSIETIEREIATQTRETKSPTRTTARIESLKQSLAALRQQRDDLFGKPGMTDEQRIRTATKGLNRSIESLETKLKSGDFTPKGSQTKTPETPELTALRTERDTLNRILRDQILAAKPKKETEKGASRLAKAIFETGYRKSYSDESIWTALARNTYSPNEITQALKNEFPNLEKAELTRALADSQQLLTETKQAMADTVLQKQNEYKLTEEGLDLIRQEKKVNNAEKRAIAKESKNFYEGLVKSNSEVILDTAGSFRKANLLTAVKTHMVNIGGNIGNIVGGEIAQVPAAMVDRVAAIFTGQRTETVGANPLIKGITALVKQDETLKNAKWNSEEGVQAGKDAAWQILKTGGSVEEMEKLQHSESILSQKYPGRPAKWMDNYINGVFRTLGAEDALFKVYAFRRSLETQAKAIALTERRADPNVNVKERMKDLVLHPTNTMQVIADDYAHEMTFQADNPISTAFTRIKAGNPKFKFFAELIVPYDRTPTNVVLQSLEYLPVVGQGITAYKGLQMRSEPSQAFRNKYTGAVRQDMTEEFFKLPQTEQRQLIESAVNNVWNRQQQAKFARSFGKSTLGAGLFATGFFMAAAGLMAGNMSFDDDDKEEGNEFKRRKKSGVENGSIYIPYFGRVVLPKTPPTTALVAGATFYEQMVRSKKSPTLAAMDSGIETFSEVAAEQPYISNTFTMMKNLQKQKYGEFAGNIVGGFVPASAMVRSISEITDDKERTGSSFKKGEKVKDFETFANKQGRGFKNTIIKGIPFARQFAPESDLAVSKEERGGVARRIVRNFDPFNIRQFRDAKPYQVRK